MRTTKTIRTKKLPVTRPIRQNRTHIKWLRSYVGPNIPLYSIIVFSERCELKQVTINSADVRVIKRDRTYATVRSIWETAPDSVPDEEVSALYEKLKLLTNADAATKAAHIDHIRKVYQGQKSQEESQAATDNKLCPRCGKTLVLRTVRSGANAGKQFWGCSGYPSCKYTENLEQAP